VRVAGMSTHTPTHTRARVRARAYTHKVEIAKRRRGLLRVRLLHARRDTQATVAFKLTNCCVCTCVYVCVCACVCVWWLVCEDRSRRCDTS